MPNNRDHSRRLLGFARRLRAESTDAEQRMWSILRGRRLQGFKFRRQVPVAGYIVDFFCIRAKLIVELDGGQHNDPETIEYDRRRTEAIEKLGIRVIRFWDDDVLRDADIVTEAIYNALVPLPATNSSPGTPGEAG